MGIKLHEIRDEKLRRRLRAALDGSNLPMVAKLREPVVEPRPQRDSPRPDCPKDGSRPRVVLRIVRRAVRLVDADNLGGAKFLIDAIRRAGLVCDDDPASIDLQLVQEKVATRAEQGTLIEIIPKESNHGPQSLP